MVRTLKMHKFSPSDSLPKLRPIVSSIGTSNYNLARFLCDLLSPLLPNDYSCKDTFSFVSQIKNANLSKTFLVSYDVTSLFSKQLMSKKHKRVCRVLNYIDHSLIVISTITG